MLLADVALWRRQDEVAVIGWALLARAAGRPVWRIAAALGVPLGTVRGWLRRFTRDAEVLRAHFTCWAIALDPGVAAVAPTG